MKSIQNRREHGPLLPGIAVAAAVLAAATALTACMGHTKPAQLVSSSSSSVSSAVSSQVSSTSASSVSSGKSSSSASSTPSSSSAPASSSASIAAGYTLYTNDRFGFSVPVLSSLKAFSNSSSGQTFTSSDNTVILSVSGGNNAENLSPSDYFDQYFYQRQAGILSKQESGDTTVITWNVDGKLGYIKSVVGTGSINTLRFQFPEGQKAQYDAAAQYMMAHFEAPGVGTAH
ncbi:hypothetical protein [Ethanoligenens harbinense]|uniref:Lipoprotein n=1 Tax=Ethanoligenens harbinense (strain DSM 18485 / JCM 12961 / CGMCC 1.5033 / YUAN-3) TaxID=663278 RepID=E6U575_ETHHY|nr:hypothetical protein [Ethanoligenens harbinense]ADU27888.1 hypothetical protein Ethha_2389 [Ethanoligenens harbinense YUAN-3]